VAKSTRELYREIPYIDYGVPLAESVAVLASICSPVKIVKASIAKERGDLKNARDINKNRRQRITYYGY
jgi:hypothetical protein